MRLLVCGGRKFSDRDGMYKVLDSYEGVEVLINGKAPGADSLAREWAVERGIEPEDYPADWDRYGKRSAGVIRNWQMLREGKPDLVVAFPGPDSKGTWHMVDIARKAGVEVHVLPIQIQKRPPRKSS